MNQSDQINELAAALAISQGSMKLAEENKMNYFKSKYASYESLRKASQKALSENGLCITHILSRTEGGHLLTTQLSHKSGQWIRSEVLLPMGKGETTHELGKSITYCKRYSYAALICIGTGEEDEDENVGEDPVVEKKAPQPSRDDFSRLEHELKDSEQLRNLLKYYKVSSLHDIPEGKKGEAMNALNSIIKNAR